MNTKNVRCGDDWIELEFNEDIISKIDEWIELNFNKPKISLVYRMKTTLMKKN